MSERKKRRCRSAEGKLRIVLAGIEPGVEISELCRREGINPAQCYAWKNTLHGSLGIQCAPAGFQLPAESPESIGCWPPRHGSPVGAACRAQVRRPKRWL